MWAAAAKAASTAGLSPRSNRYDRLPGASSHSSGACAASASFASTTAGTGRDPTSPSFAAAYRRQRPVRHIDLLGGVARLQRRLGHDEHDRIADMTNPLARKCPAR